MSAYVQITLIIDGKADQLDKFMRAVAGDRGQALSFQKIAPIERRGNADLLPQLKKTWGTTTDAQEVEFTRLASDQTVMFFETAHTFPREIIQRFVDLFEGLSFRGHFSIETGGLFGVFNGKQVETATDIGSPEALEGKPLLRALPAVQSYLSLVTELGRSGRTLSTQGFDRKGGLQADVFGPAGVEASLILGADGRVARIHNGEGNDIISLIAQIGLQTAGQRSSIHR